MSEPSRPTAVDLSRVLEQHLESLQAAGLEWVPASKEPLAPPKLPQSTALPAAAPVATSLAGTSSSLPLLQPSDNSAHTPDARRQQLDLLRQQVAACTRCAALASTRTQTVFGVGPLDPEVCFVGEAPGADEDAQGEPFVGAAGQMLNRIIMGCGMRRDEVYICNILRCRPPSNRQPLPDEAGNCREWLERQLELVRPRHLCCLGAVAAQNLLGTRLSIGKLRGRFHDYQGIPVLCTYHPSYLIRIPDPAKQREAKAQVWEDMKLLLTRMGRPIPTSKK